MLDIRTILFPTDFSDCSHDAFLEALALAEKHQAKLQLFHAVVLHGDDPTEVPESLLERLGPDLVKIAPKSVEVETFEARGLSAAPLIVEHARENSVDLIVMGTHARKGPARLLLGSVAAEVLRTSSVPVLTLREKHEGSGLGAIKRMLVPIDFSPGSEEQVNDAAKLARTYGAELDLLHVVQPPAYPYFYAPLPATPPFAQHDELMKRATRALERLWNDNGDAQVQHRVMVLAGYPAPAIVAYANQSPIDLIVTTAQGHGAFDRWILGSTSEYLVRQARQPVVVLRPEASHAASYAPGETGQDSVREFPIGA